MEISNKLFIGIGAQKAGTSWLARQLSAHPDVAFSSIQELHFWDILADDQAIFNVYQKRFRDMLQNKVNRLPNNLPANELEKIDSLISRLKMTHNKSLYGVYFEKLLLAKPSAKVTGEITPSYALLGEKAFQEIGQTLPEAKFIFIMRDPIKRLWSHIRFEETRLGKKAFSALSQWESCLDNPAFIDRSQYDHTIKRLLNAVSKDRCLFLFYEDLTSNENCTPSIKALCAFLGIDSFTPWEDKINVSVKIDMPTQFLEKALGVLESTYSGTREILGRTPSSWTA